VKVTSKFDAREVSDEEEEEMVDSAPGEEIQ
jgi:hypothetical protein